MPNNSALTFVCLGLALITQTLGAADPAPPQIEGISITNSERVLHFSPYPATHKYKVLRTDKLGQPFSEDPSGAVSGFHWKAPWNQNGGSEFYQIQVEPISSNELLTSVVLNRLAYGPTPDELERVKAMGPQAYIEEQLQPENIEEQLAIDEMTVPSGWKYITATGRGSASKLYVYLTSTGEGHIDDIKLVAGTVAEAGVNLIRNGDFEAPLSEADWAVARNHEASSIVSGISHSGQSSLHLVATSGGSTEGSAITQFDMVPALDSRSNYTLSFWFLPNTTNAASVTVRLSQNGIVASSPQISPMVKLAAGAAVISDLQNWYVARAVQTKQQLLEILTQFFDNHFTTFYTKSREYMAGRVSGDNVEEMIATEFEFREIRLWQDVLKNPNGTFYDLLKISAESPAMIIYLDTVSNKKDAANENYARELLELFTVGVDNGYDQRDIEEMSRAWTGWRVAKLPLGQEHNPFAAEVTNRNTVPGTWMRRFSASNHDTNSKSIFPGQTIDARFGPPHAGKSYELILPARSGTNGIKDGYEIIAHLADLPYTQEYLSVKLCQLFVHDNFHHGLYDYTDPNLSPEGALVRDCMRAWDTPAADGRKGNIRNILRVIFDSPMFRGHAASRQKIKTPLEFLVSSIRSIRATRPDGTFTVNSSAENIISPLRTLGMRLFYREEPDGWPELGKDWINTSALVERMRFVQDFLADSKDCDPVGLLKLKLPEAQWRDADAVADYLISTLFPGEGIANLELDRNATVAYLNMNDAGTATSLFANLNPDSSAYSNRIRSTIAFLLSLPRFQEQ